MKLQRRLRIAAAILVTASACLAGARVAYAGNGQTATWSGTECDVAEQIPGVGIILPRTLGSTESTPSNPCGAPDNCYYYPGPDTCNGKDPQANGCTSDAYVIDSTPWRSTTENDPTYSAYVELWWSPACQSNWAVGYTTTTVDVEAGVGYDGTQSSSPPGDVRSNRSVNGTEVISEMLWGGEDPPCVYAWVSLAGGPDPETGCY